VTLPGALVAHPRLDQWLRIRAGGWVEVFTGKVELGQGILTALAAIVAETLGVEIGQVRMMPASTAQSPNEGVTSGSLSVQESGAALRQVCTEARAIYLARASEVLGEAALEVVQGVIAGRTSYWALADDRLLGRVVTGAPAAVARPGRGAARIDLPDKVFGRARFIHDMVLPGMLHGRMVRPPNAAATLVAVDTERCGVTVVRDGSLLGVVAGSESGAVAEAAALAEACRWEAPAEALPDEAALPGWLRAQPAVTTVFAQDERAPAPNNHGPVARTFTAQFEKPYLAHASIGPSCALARYDGGELAVWTHSQAIFPLRRDLALALALPEAAIVLQHVEGAGCYGHNPADDVAFDAAWLALAVPGRAVRVQWSRADELGAAPFGPAMAVEIEADVDAGGGVIGWRHRIWSNGHGTRPGRASSPALLGAWAMARPFERQPAIDAPRAVGGGADRNAAPSYDFPAWTVTSHRVLAMPLRSSAMRSLGALMNVFAAEQMIDTLAEAGGEDALSYRLRHVQDPRARAVLELAAERAGWGGAMLEGQGRGLGFARYKNTGAYCAVVAEIEAAAEIRVRRLVIACDVGVVVDPDGVANQMEGGAIQATSFVLKEAVRFDRERVTSTDWNQYPILRFSEIPAVSVHIVTSAAASVGAGEASLGPTAGAIGNAVAAALRVRVRTMPMRAELVVAAMDAGVGAA